MKMKHGKYYLLTLLLVLLLAVLGCGGSGSAGGDTVISYDEAVIDGALNVGDDLVTQTMLIKEGITEEDITKLAEKIARDLKEEYPDKRINVQAVQDGVNMANILLE